jgi:hypothetical protein
MKRASLATLGLFILAVPALADPPSFAQLAGTWSCTTAVGSSVTSTFTVAANGDVSQHERWATADGLHRGTWDQTFSYDSHAAVWNVKNVGSNGWIFTGTSNGINGNIAEIIGTQLENAGLTVPVRERYTFNLPQSFEHVWEGQVNGAWAPTSYAECTPAST